MGQDPRAPPLIVGLGGTTREGSSSELVLRAALAATAALGAQVEILAGPDLVMPLYTPDAAARDPAAARLVSLLRRCDGLIIASPGYHGAMSGMIKNALDYAEDTARDARPYLDGRPVGCIACAYGWQATGSTLAGLRAVVHALRGWPTPLGVAANTATPLFGGDGTCLDAPLKASLDIMAAQLMAFRHRPQRRPNPARRRGRAQATAPTAVTPV